MSVTALKLDTSTVDQTLSLEAARPIMNGFVNQMHGRLSDAEVKDNKYDVLHSGIQELYKAFVQTKGVDKSEERFGKFTIKVAYEIASQHPYSSYLKGKDVIPVITTNNEVSNVDYGFHAEDTGSGVMAPTIGIRVGDNFRVIKLGDEIHLSASTQVKDANLSDKFHFLIDLRRAPEAKPAVKTNRLAFLTIPLTWIMTLIKIPFATKTRASMTVVVVAALAAWYFDQIPSTETFSSWGETAQSWGGTAKAYTWDQLPTWNATTTFASDLKTKYIG